MVILYSISPPHMIQFQYPHKYIKSVSVVKRNVPNTAADFPIVDIPHPNMTKVPLHPAIVPL